MKKYSLILVVVIAIVLAYKLIFAGGDEAAGNKKQGGVVPVAVMAVASQQISEKVEALGTANANESVVLTPTTSDILTHIYFEDGQQVKAGQVLATLNQEEEQAQLEVALVQRDEHQRELERLSRLLQNKAAAQRDVDERKTQLTIAEQEVKALVARIEDRTLRAPFDGVLGVRHVSAGALVQPGQVITTLDDISSIKLDFNVPERYISQLAPGVKVEAKAATFEGKVFEGAVSIVDTRVDPVTRSVLVRAILPNADGALKPGMLMTVTLLKGEHQALVVPEESVVQLQDKFFVLVVDKENKVEKRDIRPGVQRDGMIEVVEGLKAGEVIIVRGVHTAKPGEKIEVKETWENIRKPEAGNLKGDS